MKDVDIINDFNSCSFLQKIYEFIINNIRNIKETLKTKEYYNQAYNFTITKINEKYIYIKFGTKIFQFFVKSLKIKFLKNNKYEEYDLFSSNQFTNFPKELKIKNPKIIYYKNNNKFIEEYSFYKYIKIINENIENIYICNKNDIKIMQEEVFNLIKANDNQGFLDKNYKNPEEFDKNYYIYFPVKDEVKIESFYIVKTKAREDLSRDFQIGDPTYIIKYFGQQSMGKSITLIGSLKYTMDHTIFGTFYINCKSLDYYYKTDFNIFKQILIDEVAYLFFGENDIYKNVAIKIENFEKDQKDKKLTFWNLILLILNFIGNSKLYIIAFDQYNNNIDPYNQLENDLLKYKEEKELYNVSLITLSSMNNSDIKDYKLQLLLNKHLKAKNIYVEIDDFIGSELLQIEDPDIDNRLKYIGRTFDNYNAIAYLKNDQNNVESYIEKRQIHIRKRIKEFFGIQDNINITESYSIYKFLSFSVYSEYSFSEFENIYNNIPFKYFNIYKNNSNDKEFIEIDYRFPVIKDIIEDIYSSIILRKDLSTILNNNILDGGSKGTLFEKIVIHNLTPGEHNHFSVCFFNEFLIKNYYFVPKFIPKNKEKVKLKGNNKIKLEKKPFLLRQTNFGGKGLDVIIVDYNGSNAVFFCFQITKFKKKQDLLTYDMLEDNLKIMIRYMKNFFNFEIYSIYFCYIFDFTKINESKIKNMCIHCDNENIRYIFYNINDSSYYDYNNKKIYDIKNYMNKFNYINKKRFPNINFELNDNQKKEIKCILKKVYKDSIIDFKFFDRDFLCIKDIGKYNLFCITECSFLAQNKRISKTFMYYRGQNSFKCVILNKNGTSQIASEYFGALFPFQAKFDYYKILLD